MGKNQWVSPREGNWAVHGEGDTKDTELFDTQQQAIDYAREIAKKEKSELIVQGLDGKIRIKDSFGNDPKNVKG